MFLRNRQTVCYSVTRPQFYNGHVEPTAKETDGTETLEKPPHTGRPHTRCSGDSAPSSCIILSELGQYFLFCSLTIFRSLVHTIQFLLQEIYTILNTLSGKLPYLLLLRPPGLSAFLSQHPPRAENSFSK